MADQSAARVAVLRRHLVAPLNEVVDATIIGMGFSGMALSKRLKEKGYTTRSFEKGPEVGGTWYWNRYPGAACDIDSHQYSFAFSHELEQDWTWSRRYGEQPEIFEYAKYVADKFDLRAHTLFNTTVNGATYDEVTKTWTTTSAQGDVVVSKWLFLANGVLSTPATPGMISEFGGAEFHTHDWDHDVDMSGKTVGVIGTGSTATQVIPALAKQAKKLVVFQRTPAWCAPRKDRAMSAEDVAAIKADYAGYRLGRLSSSNNNEGGNAGLTDLAAEERKGYQATAVAPSKTQATAAVAVAVAVEGEVVAPAEESKRRLNAMAKALEQDAATQAAVREGGGFGVAAGFGGDTGKSGDGDAAFGPLNDEIVNARLQAHLRERIKQIVHDPATAEALTPSYPVACKRLCITDDYWPAFNKPNVSLVNLAGQSIAKVGPAGPVDASGALLVDEPLDVLVYATGFDAMTGAAGGQLGAVTGKGGVTLGDKFASVGGVQTYLGMMTAGFPNMFFMVGPQSASVLANMIQAIEHQADWFLDLMDTMKEQGKDVVECTRESEIAWTSTCDAQTAKTVWGGVGGGCSSWYSKGNMVDGGGGNVDQGSPDDNTAKWKHTGQVLPFTGGFTKYAELVQSRGYTGLLLE